MESIHIYVHNIIRCNIIYICMYIYTIQSLSILYGSYHNLFKMLRTHIHMQDQQPLTLLLNMWLKCISVDMIGFIIQWFLYLRSSNWGKSRSYWENNSNQKQRTRMKELAKEAKPFNFSVCACGCMYVCTCVLLHTVFIQCIK